MKKMKSTTIEAIANANFKLIEGETKGGKKCLALLTNKRLSTEDFKALMRDIQLAEGYGFVKYFEEHKARLISATKIDGNTFASLANQYTWAVAEKKAKKSGKGHNNTKQTNEANAEAAKVKALADILAANPELKSFLALLPKK